MPSFLRFFIVLLASSTIGIAIAQSDNTPGTINYQAIVRDTTGALLSNRVFTLTVSIHENSPEGIISYAEQFDKINSNNFGLIAIEIGGGNHISGASSLAELDWSTKKYFASIDYICNHKLFSLGTFSFLSVPYAFYAKNATHAEKADSVVFRSIKDSVQQVVEQVTKGSTGATGLIGATGSIANSGNTGITSPTGATGIQGASACTGPTGSGIGFEHLGPLFGPDLRTTSYTDYKLFLNTAYAPCNSITVAKDGKVNGLSVQLSTSPRPPDGSATFNVMINDAPSGISLTIQASSTKTSYYYYTPNGVSFSAGDRLGISLTGGYFYNDKSSYPISYILVSY